MNEREYICERIDLFDKLHDPYWFIDFIKHQYGQIFSVEKFVPEISSYQAHQAHERWVTDIERIRVNENGGLSLDHFKLAAHLAFWLKRFSPVAKFKQNQDLKIANVRTRDDGSYIYSYGNSQAAFLLGFRICSFWEAMKLDHTRTKADKIRPQDFNLADHKDFLQNVSYVLADRSSSPHALFLVYKALFIDPLVMKN